LLKRLQSYFLIALMVFTPCVALAGKKKGQVEPHVFKYKDADGNVHIGRQIPPENYKYGYTAMDEYGKVLKVVPPEPTPEEREAFKREMHEKKMAQELRHRDDQLKKTYSSVKDAISARDRKLSQIDIMSEIIRGKLAVLSANYDRVVQLAAALERDGRPVEERLLTEMSNLEKGIVELQESQKVKDDEKEKIKSDYEPIIDRLKYLYRGKKAAMSDS